jgi:DNA polymerase I-like protein with 3'-5' exonuclease and polymerase domains
MLKEHLAKFDTEDVIAIDVETISYDDNEPALKPYHGHRTGLIIIGQKKGKDNLVLSVPIRHRTEGAKCFPLESVLPDIKEFFLKVKLYTNLNIKFDLHNLAQDGLFLPNASYIDLSSMARFVDHTLLSYSLESLCELYTGTRKSDTAKVWCEKNNTKDYGRIPLDILVPYGEIDVIGALDLYYALLNRMPKESIKAFKTEVNCIKHLFWAERTGIPINKDFLLKRRIGLLHTMINTSLDITRLSNGNIENPGSSDQRNAFFTSVGIEPIERTEKGKPSWGNKVLELVNHPVAKKLVEYNKAAIQESTFCGGWISHADKDGIIHPQYRISGTRTGRLSSAEPNVQNPPEWILESWLIPDGYTGIKWDLSQIEYRIFSHYSNDAELLALYAANPKVDFHQLIADRLGMPRKPVKSINFGILYGMGNTKLTKSLTVALSEFDSPDMRIKLRKFLPAGKLIIPDIGDIDDAVMAEVSKGVLRDYNERVPAVKKLMNQVREAIQVRGKIRNFFGREYKFTLSKAYIALNYLIQGSAADYFKQLLDLSTEEMISLGWLVNSEEICDYYLYDNIHDAIVCIVKDDKVETYTKIINNLLAKAPFRVPILCDFEYYKGNFGKGSKL